MLTQWKHFLFFVSFIFSSWHCASSSQQKEAFGYRLGDMVKSKMARNAKDGRELHYAQFPNSIASEYMRKTDEDNRLDLILDILKERTTQPTQTPPPDMLVVHLRIGDVIDKTPYMVKEFLSRYIMHHNGFNYVKPLSYYQEIIEQIRPLNIKSVTLIGGFHSDTKSQQKSIVYVNKIREFFEKNGFVTYTRINFDPDEDFIFMCNAEYFTPSGGGYSSLVKNILRKKAKTIIVPATDR